MSFKEVNHGFLTQCTLIDNDQQKTYDMSKSVVDVMVKKAFIEDVFPLYVIDFKTTQELRDIMRDHNISIQLRISYYDMTDQQSLEELDNDSITELGILFDGRIRIYDKPSTYTAVKNDEDMSGETSTVAVPFVYYRISGIPEDLISENNDDINVVYADCQLCDAMINMISKTDPNLIIHMQPPTNRRKYNDVLVPPEALLPALQNIEQKYDHLYDHDMNIFLNTDGIYLYDLLSTDIPVTNNLEINILSADATSDQSSYLRPRVNEDGDIKISYTKVPDITGEKDILDHTLGSTYYQYYYDENFNLTFLNKSTDAAYDKVRYFWNKVSDSSLDSLAKGQIMNLVLGGINPELFNPFTRCRLVSSEYQDVQGEYALISASYMISSTDMMYYNGSIVLQILKK